MTPAMKDYWLRILAAFFLLKMATQLMRDAEKMMADSLKAKDAEVVSTLNGNGVPVDTEPEYAEVTADTEPDEEGDDESTDD